MISSKAKLIKFNFDDVNNEVQIKLITLKGK